MRAEWTKLRTVPAWALALPAAAVIIVLFGLFPGMQGSCGKPGSATECKPTTGPDGVEVRDSFAFAYRTLDGDGSITVRVAALTGELTDGPGLVPWAKAGLMVKDTTEPGSSYAAVMVTGARGVRMQHDFVHDKAGRKTPLAWLRLTRAGGTIMGEESADGTQWTVVNRVQLPDLGRSVVAGLFVTSPQHAEEDSNTFGVKGARGGPSQATAEFADLAVTGAWQGTQWTKQHIGGPGNGPGQGDPAGGQPGSQELTLTGSGDIAPAVTGAAGVGTSITTTLIGTFAGLIVVVVVGVLFASGEYRRGLIRTTLAAQPRRGRVLAAKAAVAGAAGFVAGLVAGAIVVYAGREVLQSNGVFIPAVPVATELRLIAGTGAMLGLTAVLGLALGMLLRRSATAITAAVVAVILPYLLAMTVLPTAAADWALRVTPAAAFAIQQSAVEYAQVANVYTPVDGYMPLSPWAGLAVLVAWTAVALSGAYYRLVRADA